MKKYVGAINKKINSLNKITLMILVLLYSVILGLTVTFVKGKEDYNNPLIPKYDHINYNDAISTTYQIVHQYSFNSKDEMSVSVGVNARLYTRPGMVANKREFMTKALLDNNRMYYFTQYSGYNYSVIHNQLISTKDNSSPVTLYSSMEYFDADGVKKYNSFKEDILTLKNEDLEGYYSENKSEIIKIEISPILKGDEYEFTFKVKINPIDETQNLTIHADVQSWGVSSDGKIYPFMGYYNYSNLYNDRMEDTSKRLPLKLGVTHIYVKVLYYESYDKFGSVNNSEEVLYKYELPVL